MLATLTLNYSGTYVAGLPTVQVAHVWDVDLELALDLLVLRQDGVYRVVVIVHVSDRFRRCRGRADGECVGQVAEGEAAPTRRVAYPRDTLMCRFPRLVRRVLLRSPSRPLLAIAYSSCTERSRPTLSSHTVNPLCSTCLSKCSVARRSSHTSLSPARSPSPLSGSHKAPPYVTLPPPPRHRAPPHYARRTPGTRCGCAPSQAHRRERRRRARPCRGCSHSNRSC